MPLETLSHGSRAYLFLALLALALYLPGINTLPVTDRDEARFAQATRQMVESGDYINIRFQNAPRNKKPAGIHWLQAAAVKGPAGGDTGAIWAYRLPSTLGALAAVLALFAFARPVFGDRAGFLASVLMATSVLTAVEAHIAKTDAVLLLCVIVGQGALMGLYRLGRMGERAPPALAAAFWAALGASILIKGPVLPAIALVTLAALGIADRRAGLAAGLRANLRPIPGLALAAAIAAPWFVAAAMGGSGFVGGAVTGDLLPKLLGGHESHGAPPGYYLLLASFSFWPGILLVPFGLVWAWRNRLDPGPRFCLAWLVPSWIAFELVPTKLPHYVLPLLPAAALLAAAAAVTGRDWTAGALARWPARLWLALWCAAGLGLAALVPALPVFASAPVPIAAWAAPLFCGLAMVAGLAGWIKRDAIRAVLAPVPAMVLFLGVVFAAALPAMTELWPSALARDLVARHRPAGGGAVAVAGFVEPSLVFALGTETRLTGAADAARHVARGAGALALIERRREARFRAALAALDHVPVPLGTVRGFNTAKGRGVVLTLYRAEPAKP
ncbi:MAG: glycosyltransferase family 39 protein [Alphaproteobacteria bacterium]|nr:glycosyltransferase family 39 protein [Alphaproteobacteria bacterium]